MKRKIGIPKIKKATEAAPAEARASEPKMPEAAPAEAKAEKPKKIISAFKKLKVTKRVAAIVIVVVVAAGAICGTAIAAKTVRGGGVVTVVSVSDLQEEWYYYGEESGLEGYVTSGASQDITLGEAEAVSEVLVKEGDHVKKGDLLMRYDTLVTNMKLEQAKLSKTRTESDLEIVKKNLKTLAGIRPVADGDTGFDFDDNFGIDDDTTPEDNTIETEVEDTSDEVKYTGVVKAHKILDKEAKCFYREKTETIPAPGSEENPYRFLCVSGAKIDAGFFKMAKKLETEGDSVYVRIEVREKDSIKKPLLCAWMQDVSKMTIPDDWEGVINTENGAVIIQETESESARKAKEEEAADSGSGGKTDSDSSNADNKSENKSDTGSSSGSNANNGGADGKAGSGSSGSGSSDSNSSGSGAADQMKSTGNAYRMMQLTMQDQSAGIESAGSSSGGFTMLAAGGLMDDDSDDTDTDSDSSAFAGGETAISADAVYTKEELQEEIKEQTEKQKELELELREADIKIAKAQKAVEQSDVKAIMDGVVTVAGDPKKPPTDGSVFLQVSGNAGVTIRSALNEQKLDEVKEGDHISVMSWSTEQTYDAEIISISPYPDSSGMFDYGQSSGQSYYPFKAVITDENVKMDNYEWVQVTLKPAKTADSGTSDVEDTSETAGVSDDGETADAADASGAGDADSAANEEIAAEADTAGVAADAAGAADEEIAAEADTAGVAADADSAADEEIAAEADISDDLWDEELSEDEAFIGDGTVYLPKAFIRDDEDVPYVYIRDENDRLVKQQVVIGQGDGEAYEIKDGVAMDDWIAFPYGKQTKEGAKTKEGSVEDIYNDGDSMDED